MRTFECISHLTRLFYFSPLASFCIICWANKFTSRKMMESAGRGCSKNGKNKYWPVLLYTSYAFSPHSRKIHGKLIFFSTSRFLFTFVFIVMLKFTHTYRTRRLWNEMCSNICSFFRNRMHCFKRIYLFLFAFFFVLILDSRCSLFLYFKF